MLTRSAKSVRSIVSLESLEINTAASDISQKSPSDEPPSHAFELLLPFICMKFNCDFDLYVKKDIIQDGVRRYKIVDTPVSYKRIGMITPSSIQMPKKAERKEESDKGHNFITLRALYDSNDSLVEIFLCNQLRIPRLLMQALAVTAQIYENVNKITICRCNLDFYTIYELNKIVSLMNLTDVCLDDSFLREANYAILLEKESTLRQLSLCRCSITDVVCEQICSKLRFPASAEKCLLLLNLSGNRITDEGTKYVGEMLRSNRSLRYLNLAGNHIGDDGVRHIFDVLMPFPLTYDEIVENRRRIFTYLKRKRELTRKFMTECEMQAADKDIFKTNFKIITNKEPSMSGLRDPSKHKTNAVKEKLKIIENKEQGKEKAEMLAIQLIGKLQGPFCHSNIVIRDGWSYCVGNLTLSYLNLSYNNLTYLSVKQVVNVLMHQSSNANGLFRIVLEGNRMPATCTEYEIINELLNKKLNINLVKEPSSRRKSRSRSGMSTASSTGKK